MRIGYSFWGFLSAGVVDTPDGGRSHRLTWIRVLSNAGYTVVFLQRDRDRIEAGEDLSGIATWEAGLPDIDLLFLEWRWPIPGRNVEITRDAPGYCPDFDRQSELVEHYVVRCRTPTIVWDKDLKLDARSPLRELSWVRIAEAALNPRGTARRLLFPIDETWYRAARERVSHGAYAAERTLVYVGNQYERDDVFDDLFARPARTVDHAVFGKWPHIDAWPHVQFHGRVAFSMVPEIYRRSVTTVLLAPARYRIAGQFTQRLFEAQLEGCFTIARRDFAGVQRVVPPWLIIDSGDEVATLARRLTCLRNEPEYCAGMLECLDRLEMFLATRQLEAFAEIVDDLS